MKNTATITITVNISGKDKTESSEEYRLTIPESHLKHIHSEGLGEYFGTYIKKAVNEYNLKNGVK